MFLMMQLTPNKKADGIGRRYIPYAHEYKKGSSNFLTEKCAKYIGATFRLPLNAMQYFPNWNALKHLESIPWSILNWSIYFAHF